MTTILVVEDEVGVRLAFVAQMKSFGEVIAVKNREEAFRTLKDLCHCQKPLDLALVDLQLPDRSGTDTDSGFSVAERIQQDFEDTPIILVTIRNDRAAWERAETLSSVRGFFTKPWSSSELKELAKKCLEGSARGMTLRGSLEGVNQDEASG